MNVRSVVPILNVSDVRASIAWFERLGWMTTFEWDDQESGEPSFGGVGNGHAEVFLCRNGQGGEIWMSWFLPSRKDVDAVHARVVELGYDVTREPVDEPWGLHEFHLRHPDGHTIRVSASS